MATALPWTPPELKGGVSVQWWLCELKSGRFLTELPVDSTEPLRNYIASEDQFSADLVVEDDACPDDWPVYLQAGNRMLAQVLFDEKKSLYPVNQWFLEEARAGGVTIPMTGKTLETCLARTNVPDLTATDDPTQVAKQLCAPVVSRFGFTIRDTNTGATPIDVDYSNEEDRSVLSALQDMMKLKQIEFRIFLEWQPTTQRFTKVLQIGPVAGTLRRGTVLDHDADQRGSIASYTRGASYAAGKGATYVIGVSEGSGSSRVLTDPVTADDLIAAGYPTWEERVPFTAVGSDDLDDATLLVRTQDVAASRKYGTETWQITARGDAVRPGRDYIAGDTLPFLVSPQGKRDPIGGSGNAAVLGSTWDIDKDEVVIEFVEEDPAA